MVAVDCVAPKDITIKPINKYNQPYIEYVNPSHMGDRIMLTFNSGGLKVDRRDSMQEKKPQIQPYQHFTKDESNTENQFTISKELMDLIAKQMQNKDSYSLGEYTIIKTPVFERLKKLDSHIDQAIDEIMYETTLERKDDVADISLATVMNELDIDIESIMELMDSIEEDC
ncbi:hypothetical protein [Bacillus toyonensis]|uniref:hypothetical protein n=1 Tax=Bacillus toyonensis TaxID=155322 RepID=UPI001C0B82D8|nr:hypothetical protein [Bacillus toyonensis]MBU4639424.1 hypothetical protein [Bacillus toyonensis]